ncbi:MAG: general secretion pathway protein GspB [Xanthomonadaceae bacterium]|nr:general secretion pathway protein GspB [Xanthomonadaceae bacterium]
MSLILEALRKSEAERRRDNTPDVALELPPAPTRTSHRPPAWLLPMALLTVALLALGGWLGTRMATRDNAASAPSASAQDSADTTTPAVATPSAPAPLPAPQSASTFASASAPSPATATMVATPATIPAPLPKPAVPPRPEPAAPAVPPPAPVLPASAVPNLADTGLPPVKLSMHMWDADPGKRFVILDGQRMGEGDRSGALSVITIERNGVVIERNGQRARIPLP